MDIIYLHGLKVDCIIGVWEWERRIPQTLTLDLDMGFDISAASNSDALADTLSYKDVGKRVAAFVRASEYNLVEKLAEQIAQILLSEFSLDWCRVRVNKFGAISGAGDVGVVIERRAPKSKPIPTPKQSASDGKKPIRKSSAPK